MEIENHHKEIQPPSLTGDSSLILPLTGVDRSTLSLVGGKAANLGELIHAGFAVPPGFCLTTKAYDVHTKLAGISPLLTELATVLEADETSLKELSLKIYHKVLELPLPPDLTEIITKAYQSLCPQGPGPVAVRSSATTEDLPGASFAGQQETMLNVTGNDALLLAVRRCWASLWLERAVIYRHNLGLDPSKAAMAVVVQRMVEASVAGVLFTANPLTGKRQEAVIEASHGLGEAVVSGAINPEHFVVNTVTEQIVTYHPGGQVVDENNGTGQEGFAKKLEEASLSLSQVSKLAAIGKQVENYFGVPQDLEWAFDQSGSLWLLQARTITTLYPLPPGAPSGEHELRVYLSFNAAQGTYRPFTPLGNSAIRMIASSITTFVGFPPHDPYQGSGFMTEAGMRLFVDLTAALRSSFGRKLVPRVLERAESRTGTVVRRLANDPRFTAVPTPRGKLLKSVVPLLVRTRLPFFVVQTLASPSNAHKRLVKLEKQFKEARRSLPSDASPQARLAVAEKLLFEQSLQLVKRIAPVMLSGMESLDLAGQLLGSLATQSELQVVMRGLPHNPTTEMNLDLWRLARLFKANPVIIQMLSAETSPARLIEAYYQNNLPASLQAGLAEFLSAYGHRSVAELDLGLPRWSEDPAYLFSLLASYLHGKDQPAPDEQYRKAKEEAECMVAELSSRAGRRNPLRGLLIRFFLSRARGLGGMREAPRNYLALLLAEARAIVWPVGEKLVEEGCLEKAEDIFFLTWPEIRQALAGSDKREVVSERRVEYEQELHRRHVPHLLLSDGTEPAEADEPEREKDNLTLRGVAASPGKIRGTARVVLDPATTKLAPGEILVAPSTDPGWTPLFLTAGGLVMELGGPLSHGAVVAREYGIPAVVGVAGATDRIKTGQPVTVDGTGGLVTLG